MYKDLKYIIKRVIIGTLIALILITIKQYKVNAIANNILTIFTPVSQIGSIQPGNQNIYLEPDLNLANWGSDFGNGYLYMNLYISTSYNGVNRTLIYATLLTNNGNGYACDIGNATTFSDSNLQKAMYSVKCPIYLGPNDKIQTLKMRLSNVQTPNNVETNIVFGPVMTFVPYHIENNNSNQGVVSAVTNVNTSINNQTQQVTNSINNVNTTINDGTIDNNSVNTDTSDWANMNATNGTITNLLTLPIQLLNAYVNGINSNCSGFSLGNLMGTNIVLPCINISNLIGSAIWSTIDVLFSGFMIFNIAKKLIKIFNDFTNLRSNQIDELYGGGA